MSMIDVRGLSPESITALEELAKKLRRQDDTASAFQEKADRYPEIISQYRMLCDRYDRLVDTAYIAYYSVMLVGHKAKQGSPKVFVVPYPLRDFGTYVHDIATSEKIEFRLDCDTDDPIIAMFNAKLYSVGDIPLKEADNKWALLQMDVVNWCSDATHCGFLIESFHKFFASGASS